ncbi:MAG: outer membrane lipoprotein chaperone LolA [Ottowia sp.]|nr:outer membrane lipoprotein chaperone LolA [Ottowia sp.]
MNLLRTSVLVLAGMMLALAAVLPARADGLQSLDAFISHTHSGAADFVQTVTSPGAKGQPDRVRKSSGRFMFERPGRFRFDYVKPFEQEIVADGQTLWLYDVDLEQVTRRPQEQVLGQTPAALVAAAADVKALDADFKLAAQPDEDGLQWVEATPRQADGQLQAVRMGFDGERLAVLEILDSFGQQSVLHFSNFQDNPDLPDDTFVFAPPAGVDVIQP